MSYQRAHGRFLLTAGTSLALGLVVGAAGRAGNTAAVLFGCAALAAVFSAILQQTLP